MSNKPLADRIRPQSIDDFIGQEHLTGENGVIRKMIESGRITSFILWGPPGVGKTTLANIIAKQTGRVFYTLNAVSSGVKDVRKVIESAEKQSFFDRPNPILFIDEIHRFSKSQQDSLLAAVEKGIFTLIGATTENPSFEVIPPLLSRCQVYVLEPFDETQLEKLLERAINTDKILKNLNIKIKETDALFRFAGGDGRKLLNIIDLLINTDNSEIIIDNKSVIDVLQHKTVSYDKTGEMHYDIISAFIKSVRGSDPNAAIYWLARMLEGGEDIKFIARRLVILAAEDIGLANPNALLIANACFEAVSNIGMPEARIILSQATIYLASSPKSNSAYMAINQAIDFVRKTGNKPVPLHLRNAPTKLMKQIGYGVDYKYAHSFENNFVFQEYMPQDIKNTQFYYAGNNQHEQKMAAMLKKNWKDKYKY